MIKKATLEEVRQEIDSLHHVTQLKQLASNSENDNTKLAAISKLLEIDGILKGDGSKVTAKGSNIELVVEH